MTTKQKIIEIDGKTVLVTVSIDSMSSFFGESAAEPNEPPPEKSKPKPTKKVRKRSVHHAKTL